MTEKKRLFIIAKTFGAADLFVKEHQLRNRKEFKDGHYLHRTIQLYGRWNKDTVIVQIPRSEEYENYNEIKKEAKRREIKIISASEFLESLKPDG